MTAGFYLASRSPRRRELLAQLGLVAVAVLPADIDETPAPGQSPADYALGLALGKARAAAAVAPQPLPVLGADTDVSIDGRILGKPRDRDDALAMLALLSGRWHEVTSAVAMVHGAHAATRLSVTRVKFGTVDPAEALAYWHSGEPADKAGAYAIQGYAARWVERIEGSYSGVVGLPLAETCALLAEFAIHPQPQPQAQTQRSSGAAQ